MRWKLKLRCFHCGREAKKCSAEDLRRISALLKMILADSNEHDLLIAMVTLEKSVGIHVDLTKEILEPILSLLSHKSYRVCMQVSALLSKLLLGKDGKTLTLVEDGEEDAFHNVQVEMLNHKLSEVEQYVLDEVNRVISEAQNITTSVTGYYAICSLARYCFFHLFCSEPSNFTVWFL